MNSSSRQGTCAWLPSDLEALDIRVVNRLEHAGLGPAMRVLREFVIVNPTLSDFAIARSSRKSGGILCYTSILSLSVKAFIYDLRIASPIRPAEALTTNLPRSTGSLYAFNTSSRK